MSAFTYKLLTEHSPQWYAVHTRSRFEKAVSTQLSAKAVEVYLPSFGEVHKWKDRNKFVEMPVFPGYVFVRFAGDSATRLQIMKTPGAVRILGNRDTILPVPDDEINSVRRLLLSTGKCASHPFVREGDWVRVRRGPLQDLEGLLVRIKNQNRLVIAIELLSQAVSTEVDAGDVEPIRRNVAHRRVLQCIST